MTDEELKIAKRIVAETYKSEASCPTERMQPASWFPTKSRCHGCPLEEKNSIGKKTTCRETIIHKDGVSYIPKNVAARNWLIENCTEEELLEYLL